MSLTSYRAAPPRDNQSASRAERVKRERELGGLAGLAATDSSASVEAVPWALRVFTAEFGMGSGVWPLAMATRPAKLPGGEGECEVRSVWSRVGLGAARGRWCGAGCTARWDQADRAISTGQLRGLLPFHLRPIDVVVYHGSWRDLVLRRVSRLDAFSGYPVRT